MKRIDIVVNSVHGNTSFIREIQNANSTTIDVHVHNTHYQGHARKLAEEICQKESSLVIAAGGDGTAHEVINGLLSCDHTLPLFGIIPVGTGNDFMRGKSHFTTVDQLLESLEKNKIIPTDLGQITHQGKKTYFLNIADTGFGGATVHTLNKQRNWLGGKLSYSLAILRTFITFRKPVLKIESKEWRHEGEVLLCAFCNGGIFGSGLTIHPEADPHDGQLEITLIGNVSLFDYIRYLPRLKKGQRIEHKEVKYLRSNKIAVSIQNGVSSTEADGEPICETAFEVELLPQKINFLIP